MSTDNSTMREFLRLHRGSILFFMWAYGTMLAVVISMKLLGIFELPCFRGIFY